MWFCHHPDGAVLVYRVHAAGHHSPATCHPFPNDGHHGVWEGILQINSIISILHPYIPKHNVQAKYSHSNRLK